MELHDCIYCTTLKFNSCSKIYVLAMTATLLISKFDKFLSVILAMKKAFPKVLYLSFR